MECGKFSAYAGVWPQRDKGVKSHLFPGVGEPGDEFRCNGRVTGVSVCADGMETLTLFSGIRTAREMVVISSASVVTGLAVVLQGSAEKKGEQRTERACLQVTKSHHQSPAGTQNCSALRDQVSAGSGGCGGLSGLSVSPLCN